MKFGEHVRSNVILVPVNGYSSQSLGCCSVFHVNFSILDENLLFDKKTKKVKDIPCVWTNLASVAHCLDFSVWIALVEQSEYGAGITFLVRAPDS